ncbi:hypothetical protein GOP47_0011083 [Adiantum capillus-veneris]|uniref:Sucrose phosphatase-like domain-containing protein n=1 Tax=Adiantum capillus-veneris TaxID=13818 RepID=A0A9D4USH6_ADICA|nr:hypothetical protein GOP47_0011083 [Adiantum capillus-veneris]
MIVFDLDRTIVDHHDDDITSILAVYYPASLLVFSTRRSPTLYTQLKKEKPLLTPNIAIMSVGTEIMYGASMTSHQVESEIGVAWYSEGVDLDNLPEGAGKDQALAYLLRKFKAEGRSPYAVLVCGDSNNDAELFNVPNVDGKSLV